MTKFEEALAEFVRSLQKLVSEISEAPAIEPTESAPAGFREYIISQDTPEPMVPVLRDLEVRDDALGHPYTLGYLVYNGEKGGWVWGDTPPEAYDSQGVSWDEMRQASHCIHVQERPDIKL